MTPTERLLNALRSRGFEPKKRGSQWRCRCPAHDDENPSLSISEGEDGRALVKCFAGCTAEAVTAKVHLSMADLMPTTGRFTAAGIFAPATEPPRADNVGAAANPAPTEPAPGIPPPKSGADAAADLLRRGIMPLPVPFKSKNPGRNGWTSERVSEGDIAGKFKGRVNIGALWGEPSNNHVDVDLDDARALRLADQYLPKTPAEWGRTSTPRSHRIYRTSAPVETVQHRLPDTIGADRRVKKGAMIVELRSTGCQTIAPGSTHPEGEVIRWDSDGEPALVDPVALRRAVEALAEAVRKEAVQDAFPPPLDLFELREKYPQLRDPVLDGLLREGEVMNVIAPPKRGKSWLVAGLAMRVAYGGRWLDTFRVAKPGTVLILDNELHLETLSDRLHRVAKAMGVEPADYKGKLYVESHRGGVVSVERVMSRAPWCRENGVRLVIIDAMYRLATTGVSENDNAAMAQLYGTLDRFAAESGSAVVLVHHSSKGSQSEKDVVDVGAGAGAQARAADNHVVLRAHQEADVVVLEAAVRSWPPVIPICIRWNYPAWTLDAKANPADLKGKHRPKEKKDSDWTAEEFVEQFVTSKATGETTIISVANDAGLSKRKAKDLLKMAVEDGLVMREQDGRNSPARYSSYPDIPV